MLLFSIALGFLFIYYLLIYISLVILSKRKNKLILYIGYFLFLVPIVWLIIDGKSLFEFLL